LVKFHRNPAGGLLLLEVKAEIRVFPEIYGSPRAALHLDAIFVIARALLVAEFRSVNCQLVKTDPPCRGSSPIGIAEYRFVADKRGRPGALWCAIRESRYM